jgi:hypothetical protein
VEHYSVLCVLEELVRMSTVLTDLCGSPECVQANVAIMFGSWLPPSPSKSSLTFQRTFFFRFVRRSVTLTDENGNGCID